MALSADRNTPYRKGDIVSDPVKASTKIYAGALVCLDASGWAQPGATATTLKARGRAEEQVDNSDGANGAVRVQVRRGCFAFKNSGSDAIARSHIGGTAYIVDDETVAATSGTNTRSAAGKIIDIDAEGVWVEIL
ncbi:MAG: hypothetical protein KF765_12260 [Parvibaculaceae bacterium]|nr:hypothetical protein [Parvibaculaceae bacterium]